MSRPDRKIRSTRVLGALFVLAGFGAIGAGWYGMISQDQSVDRQFPYLISGGAAGIALLLFGVALLVIAQIRTERRRLSVALERFRPAGRLVGSMPPTPEAEGSAFPGRYLKMFGLAVCAAGFASIAIGWNGSARLTVVDQQFPFLLSGGVLGIALVLFGVGVLMLAQIKTERQKLARSLRGVGGVRPRVAERAVVDGGALDDGIVLAGPSTYHRAECALIRDRPGLDPVTVEEARAQGLTECRVCRPTHRPDQARKAPVAAAKAGTDGAGVRGAAEASGAGDGADGAGSDIEVSGADTEAAGPSGDEDVETDGSRRGQARRRGRRAGRGRGAKSEAVASGGRDVA